MARPTTAAESSGRASVYIHCGSPKPGEVTSKRYSSHTTLPPRTMRRPNITMVASVASISAMRRPCGGRRSANQVMRIWRSAAVA
jgi:hypothetical protein